MSTTYTFSTTLYGFRSGSNTRSSNMSYTLSVSSPHIGHSSSYYYATTIIPTDSTNWTNLYNLYNSNSSAITSITLTLTHTSTYACPNKCGTLATDGTASAKINTTTTVDYTTTKNSSTTTKDITSLGIGQYGYAVGQNSTTTNIVNITVSKAIITVVADIPTYAVSYNANGHGTAPSSQTKTWGTNLTLQSFIGSQSSGGTTSTYTITGNGGSGSWSGSNGSASYTSAKTTYTQKYWNTNSGGTGTNYSSGGTYSTESAQTFYAIWSSSTTAASYTYTLPTGTPTKSNTTTTVATITFDPGDGSTTKTSASSTRTDSYTFKGWFTASSGGTQRATSSQVTASETVYAQFTTNTGTVTSITTPTSDECIRENCNLLGWDTSSAATTVIYEPGASYTPSSSETLYAVWQILDTSDIHYYNGSTLVDATIYYYNGSTLVEADIYYYDGTNLNKCT